METDRTLTIHAVDEAYALSKAYVPEHIPGLMTAISQASTFQIKDCIGFAKDNWVIFVGYPLDTDFNGSHCDALLKKVREIYQPHYLWFIGPEVPLLLAHDCQSRQSDQYLVLDLREFSIKPSLQREIHQASKNLMLEQAHQYTQEHQVLADELVERIKLPPIIAELYSSMPAYVNQCESALVLNARGSNGKLTAFFVLELAAESFDTYILGCHSKANYMPHASDFLFAEMISYTQQRGKSNINLGLGVNPGIRRFKMKWGGKPTIRYEFCECYYGPPKQISALDSLLGEFF